MSENGASLHDGGNYNGPQLNSNDPANSSWKEENLTGATSSVCHTGQEKIHSTQVDMPPCQADVEAEKIIGTMWPSESLEVNISELGVGVRRIHNGGRALLSREHNQNISRSRVNGAHTKLSGTADCKHRDYGEPKREQKVWSISGFIRSKTLEQIPSIQRGIIAATCSCLDRTNKVGAPTQITVCIPVCSSPSNCAMGSTSSPSMVDCSQQKPTNHRPLLHRLPSKLVRESTLGRYFSPGASPPNQEGARKEGQNDSQTVHKPPPLLTANSSNNLRQARSTIQFRLAKMSFYLILLWFISWSPIATLAMLNSVLRCHQASALAIFTACTMTKLGPTFDVLIYGISHPKIKSRFRQIVMRSLMLWDKKRNCPSDAKGETIVYSQCIRVSQ